MAQELKQQLIPASPRLQWVMVRLARLEQSKAHAKLTVVFQNGVVQFVREEIDSKPPG